MIGLGVLVLMAVTVIADTEDKTVGGTIGYPSRGAGQTILLERTLDFSSSSHTGTAENVYQMFNVPAGTFIVAVGYEIEDNGNYTGEDSTLTIDIGDGDDTDGWIDGANCLTGQTAVAMSAWSFGSSLAVITNVADTTGTFVTNVTDTTGTFVTNVTDTTGTFVTNVTDTTIELVYMTNITTTTTNYNGTNFIASVTALFATQTVVTATATGTDDAVTATAIVTDNAVVSTATGTDAAVTATTSTTATIYPITSAPVAYAGGQLYTSTDTIDVTLNNDADQLKITVRALAVPLAGL